MLVEGRALRVLLKNVSENAILLLTIETGIMVLGRGFAGPVVHRFSPQGVLLISTILAAAGLYILGHSTGNMLFVGAIVFGIGVCYFWPTMIGYVAENIPLTGAFGLSIMGGMGMFATSIFQPIIGKWLDANTAEAAKTLTGDAVALAAGQATMAQMVLFPSILIVAFAGLYFFGKKAKHA